MCCDADTSLTCTGATSTVRRRPQKGSFPTRETSRGTKDAVTASRYSRKLCDTDERTREGTSGREGRFTYYHLVITEKPESWSDRPCDVDSTKLCRSTV